MPILTCTAVIGKGSADGMGAKPWSMPVLGDRHPSTAWVYQIYRRRFGIETSYRQLHQAHIKTSTRDPTLRLLFIGIALILLNIWVWVH